MRGMSRMLLAPGADDGDGRAGQLGQVGGDVPRHASSRWAPPMPPVAKRRMPARWASIIVAATVVAAVRRCATATARSRRLAFSTSSLWARLRSSSSVRPTVGRPSSTAMVAGTAPSVADRRLGRCAVSRFSGQGRPWAISVDSRATTGSPSRMRRRLPAARPVRSRSPWPTLPAGSCEAFPT